MARKPNSPNHPTHVLIAKWCIWSIKHQTWLAGQVRIYVWGATAVVAFFMFAGVIPLEEGLLALFFCGVSISTIIWLLIKVRRSWLLNIQEPELRQQALTAMINYLHEVNHSIPETPRCDSISGPDSRKHVDCTHTH
jgi:hypothetical protein